MGIATGSKFLPHLHALQYHFQDVHTELQNQRKARRVDCVLCICRATVVKAGTPEDLSKVGQSVQLVGMNECATHRPAGGTKLLRVGKSQVHSKHQCPHD